MIDSSSGSGPSLRSDPGQVVSAGTSKVGRAGLTVRRVLVGLLEIDPRIWPLLFDAPLTCQVVPQKLASREPELRKPGQKIRQLRAREEPKSEQLTV